MSMSKADDSKYAEWKETVLKTTFPREYALLSSNLLNNMRKRPIQISKEFDTEYSVADFPAVKALIALEDIIENERWDRQHESWNWDFRTTLPLFGDKLKPNPIYADKLNIRRNKNVL